MRTNIFAIRGKLLKIRSDMLFLHLMVGLARKLIILTEPSMYEVCRKESNGGRAPNIIGDPPALPGGSKSSTFTAVVHRRDSQS